MGKVLGITLPNTPLWAKVQDRVIDYAQNGNFERVPIPIDPIRYLNENFANSDHSFTIGTYQLVDHTDKIKYLTQWPFTFGEVAHNYLEICEEESNQKLKWKPQFPASKGVLYFTGPRQGFYSYVDIKSCYFSLYWPCTLDLWYDKKNCRVKIGKVPFYEPDELEMIKTVRNMVFGMMRKKGSAIFQDGKYNLSKRHSRFYRPDVTDYVLDTVQAVAQEAIFVYGFKIHAWLTDAAIIEIEQTRLFQEFLAREWFLSSEIKAIGPASLFASNCFQIGKNVTQQLAGWQIWAGNPVNTMEPVNIERLKRYRKWLVGY